MYLPIGFEQDLISRIILIHMFSLGQRAAQIVIGPLGRDDLYEIDLIHFEF
jgi:hypothetical protein